MTTATLADTGKTTIDASFLNSLIAAGVKQHDARELARTDAFGGASPSEWIVGLRAAATLMNHGTITLDWGTLPTPWESVCPAMAAANGTGTDTALVGAISTYGASVQVALINAIGAVVTKQGQDKPIGHITKTKSEEIKDTATFFNPVDPALTKQVLAVLSRKGRKEQQRKKAGELILDWLLKNGKFIRTVYGESYYLYRSNHRLFKLNTENWYSWLYRLTSINPASTEFRYIKSDCETMALECGEQLEVVRLAHWDIEQEVLRISRFDGQVYRLDGMTIELESNGDGPVLFEDRPFWLPYLPDFNTKGATLAWTTNNLANWENDPDECSFIFRAWWLASFFTELCPTRPILVLKGGKGGGKSMSLRVMLKMFFGPSVDVVGVPDKGDDFMALTSNAHIVALDNMDEPIKEVRDRIASLSTGKLDEIRKLYTTNDNYYIRYRCWLAVTSRTPDTLQRDDLVDRILILPTVRIEDSNRTRESYFLMEVLKKRNAWWGDVLAALNAIVYEIRKAGLPQRSGLRMEDWAALATVIARTADQQEVWENGLKGLKSRQSEFLLEDNVVLAAIEAWIADPTFTTDALPTRKLYELTKSALFGRERPDWSWPQSVKAFGRKLTGMHRELQEHLAKDDINVRWANHHNQTVYYFERVTVKQSDLPLSGT